MPVGSSSKVVHQKRKRFLKPTSEGFLFFLFQKNLILTGKKHCGESPAQEDNIESEEQKRIFKLQERKFKFD